MGWNFRKSKLENYTPVADTPEKRFLEFIYNEYAREFNEEFIYYGVIHHAGVQAQRIQWHNQMGANSANNTYPVGSWDVSDNVNGGNGQTGNAKGNFQNYMTLKPFSRTFIELLTDEMVCCWMKLQKSLSELWILIKLIISICSWK